MPRPSASTDVFRAIADETRRSILGQLADGQATAGAIARRFGLCQSTVSEHLAVLRRVGLVSFEQVGSRRLYRLEPTVLEQVRSWLTDVLTERDATPDPSHRPGGVPGTHHSHRDGHAVEVHTAVSRAT